MAALNLERYVVAYGNPFDGITLVGVFTDTEEAADYAEDELRNEEWWTILVHPPAEGSTA